MLLGLGLSAQAQNPALEAQSTAKIKKSAPKTWKVFGTLEHYFPVDTDQETIGFLRSVGFVIYLAQFEMEMALTSA